ncbi:MAG: FMN-binding protein [Prevotella sp.]|nr:FMN-binding protein [Prevotella sp.]
MRKMTLLTVALCVIALTATLTAAMPGKDNVITKEGGMTVVNTTTLAKDVVGYNNITPVKIYIKGNKIEKIEALPNDETPRYFAKVKKNLLDKWNGMTVAKAQTAQVDVVTGATLSSKAVIENVRRGLKYFKNRK